MNVAMNLYIHVNVEPLGAVVVPPPAADPVPAAITAIGTAAAIQDYRLRQCWYAVLDEGSKYLFAPI